MALAGESAAGEVAGLKRLPLRSTRLHALTRIHGLGKTAERFPWGEVHLGEDRQAFLVGGSGTQDVVGAARAAEPKNRHILSGGEPSDGTHAAEAGDLDTGPTSRHRLTSPSAQSGCAE